VSNSRTHERVDVSLFPEENVLTKEIETWRGFIEKLPSEDDKAILTKLLNDCHKYGVAMNNHDIHFPTNPSSSRYYYLDVK
jgi:hypothetical protein